MMGKDVERILVGINAVKDAATSSINSLSNTISYRIISDAQHGGMSSGPCYPEEKAVPSLAISFVKPIRSAMSSIASDQIKMNKLSSGLYTSINSFNNGYGSPWTELNKLETAIVTAENFAASHPTIEWIGEKAGLLGILNTILSLSIDSKWALIIYHDYIQRGYDNIFNNNTPSITFASGINKDSTGNVNQDFDENVNIKPQSVNPFH